MAREEQRPGSPGRARRKGYFGVVLLMAVFAASIALAAALYPHRGEVSRPRPFSLLLQASQPVAMATQFIGLAPDPAGENGSAVKVSVTPHEGDLYGIRVTWTYRPDQCGTSTDQSPSTDRSCVNAGEPVEAALSVILPPGAVMTTCERCHLWSAAYLDRTAAGCKDRPYGRLGRLPCGGQLYADMSPVDSVAMPESQIVDVNDGQPPGLSVVTARFAFEVRDRRFGWDSNGLTTEGILPSVAFRDAQNDGFGSLEVSYPVAGGAGFDWSTGPAPDGLNWSEPLGASTTVPVEIGGTSDSAARTDTLDTLLAGALLGIAGGALIGAIQELLHLERRSG